MIELQQAFDKRATKLNKIEQLKTIKNPSEAFEMIEQYAKNGYKSMLPEDKSYFLKCFGIFDKPATPNEFMMRIRVSGGQLTFNQAKTLGEVARDFGQDYIDLTTRSQIELRYISIENMPKVLSKLDSVGISTFQTGVDNFRGLVADPLDNLVCDNILPSQELLIKLQSKFLHNKEWISALPRKFNTSISGSITNRCNVFGHDCCFVLAQKNGIYGYNLYLGGKVGKIAQNADIFLETHEDVIIAYEALISIFKNFGFRDNRNKNRLFFLIQSVGIETISKAIREYANVDFATSGVTLTALENHDSDQGKSVLKDNTFAMHVVVLAGVFSGSDMITAALLSKKYGSGNIRLDIEQNLYLMNIKKEFIKEMLNEDFFKKYQNISSPYSNHLIACAGQKHCQFGVIPNKPDAIEMAKYLEKKVPLSNDSKVKMYWSGCVKGCGLHDLGDIGFEGCKVKLDGKNEYGVHIFLGGNTAGNAEIGHHVLRSVPLRFAKYHVESLVLEYRRLKHKHESFGEFYKRVLSQYSKAAIEFKIKLMTYIRQNNFNIDIGFKEDIKTGRNENFEIFELGRALYKSIMSVEPYSAYESFAPLAITKKLQKPESIKIKEHEVDESIIDMIDYMIREKNRAIVFSELTSYL